MDKDRRSAIVKMLRSELSLGQPSRPPRKGKLQGQSIILGIAAAGALMALAFVGIDSALVIAQPAMPRTVVRASNANVYISDHGAKYLVAPSTALDHATDVFLDTSLRLGAVNCCAANSDQISILN